MERLNGILCVWGAAWVPTALRDLETLLKINYLSVSNFLIIAEA